MFSYPMISPSGGGAVVSIEALSFRSDGATTTEVLTKGQDPTKCIPFVSLRRSWTYGGDDSNGNSMVSINIWDDGGTPTVTLDKMLTRADDFLTVYVVEFSEDVNVQKVWYDADVWGTAYAWYATCSAVETDKAFIVLTQTTDSDHDDWEDWATRVRFGTSTRLDFTRGLGANGPAADQSGYVYIVEDPTETLFTVQTVEADITTSGNTDKTITEVDLDKTMLLFNSCNNYNASNNGFLLHAWLEDSTTVRFNVNTDSAEHDATAFVVTWKDGTTVQHIADAYTTPLPPNPGESQTRNLSITTVDPAVSIAFSTNQNPRGYTHQSTITTGWANHETSQELQIADDGSTLDLTAYAQYFTEGDLTGKFNVVSFKI